MRFSALSWQYYNHHFYCAFCASFNYTWVLIVFLTNTLTLFVNSVNHTREVQEVLQSLSVEKCDTVRNVI